VSRLRGSAEERARRRKASEAVARLDAGRVARGECRHCGGPVPCSSSWGDIRVGVRRPWHTTEAAKRLQAAAWDDFEGLE